MPNGNNEKYKLSSEFLRYSHDLVAKKFHTMVIVNGILFGAFNLLKVQSDNSQYFRESLILSIVGLGFSCLWLVNVRRSIRFTKYFKEQMENINDTSIKVLEKDMSEHIGKCSSGSTVFVGIAAQIALWAFLVSYFVLPEGLWRLLSFLLYAIIGLLFTILWIRNII